MYDKTTVGLGILAELKKTCRSLGFSTRMSRLMPPDPDAPGSAWEGRKSHGRSPYFTIFSVGILAGAIVVALTYILDTGLLEYETPVGGQQILRLADRSVCRLNTATKIKIRETRSFVTIVLLQGEVLCRLTHRLGRTVQVLAGSATITDVGTEFDVRIRGSTPEVTVMKGEVKLAIPVIKTASLTDKTTKRLLDTGPTERTVSAGERWKVVIDRDHILIMIPEAVTLPQIYRSIAWERGRVIFSSDTISDAVAEMNRYNVVQIVVRDPAIAALRFSGSFWTTDPFGLVLSVAQEFKLQYRQVPASDPATRFYLE
jgi:ferric-dicitrate binding protein FerR (iron transport regulator)